MINIDLTPPTFTTAERNAWQTLRPKIKTHLAKIFRIYRNLPSDKQIVMRQHCQILDNVLDMLGE